MTDTSLDALAQEVLLTDVPKIRADGIVLENLLIDIHIETNAIVDGFAMENMLTDPQPYLRVDQIVVESLSAHLSQLFRGLQVEMAELWFAPGIFIDFSDPANRAKFHDANQRPVSLGSDGSLPTGAKPLVYLTVPADLNPYGFISNETGNGSMVVRTENGDGAGFGLAETSPTD